MKTQIQNWKQTGAILFALGLCAATEVHAQFGGFGGGGFSGGGTGNRSSSSTSSSSQQYNANGAVGNATISYDPDTQNITIVADEETTRYISEVVSNLDQPQPQVLIKVVFLEVTHNNSLDFGVEGTYSGVNSKYSAITGFMTNFSLINAGTSNAAIVPSSVNPIRQTLSVNNNFGLASSATSPNGIYQFMGSDFQATLRAIATAGKAEVLSRPSILARNGQLAEIVVGQSIYLPSGVSYATVGTTGTTIPTINGSYQNVGIILDVTPFIGNNNLVQMILQPKTTSVDTSTPGQVIAGGSLLASAVYAPNINTRSANTVVVTPDGQTVVIGGLMENQKASTDNKIPILGDIPLLGNFFKHKQTSSAKTELLIFLTPHIVQTPSQLAALSSDEKARTLTPKSYSEEELNRFLDQLPLKKGAKNKSSSN